MDQNITVEYKGKEYSGSCSTSKGVLTVTYSGTFKHKTTQIGSLPSDVLAKQLLLELVREEEKL